MRCQSMSPCKVAGLLGACLLTSIAIQTFVALIAAAVSIGNGYAMWFAVAHVFSWPIFFLSLFLSLLMMATCLLKHCCKSGTSSTEKTGCCTPSDETTPTDSPH